MECADYFRSQAGYDRCFAELLKKWKSYGRPAGVIVLEDPTEEERRLLGGILGKTFYDGKIRFSFAEFEKGLQKTRFAPVDMKELLENYFGMELFTNQERKRKNRKDRENFFRDFYEKFAEGSNSGLSADGKEPAAAFWIRQMTEKKSYGYHILSREYGKDRKAAGILAENAGKALSVLFPERGGPAPAAAGNPADPAEDQRENPGGRFFLCGEGFRETVLAVFAAEISGNPHYFDRGTTAGQLLTNALCCVMGQPLPENAHQWKELLLRAGIAPDYVSSLVHVYGVSLETAEGRHPAFEAFRNRREPCAVTLENLRNIVSVRTPRKKVFVVENEMVFSFLTEQLRDKDRVPRGASDRPHRKYPGCRECQDAALLCTSGQLRTAALRLLTLLADSGYQICYSGDMDPEGIDIADRLWKHFGGKVEIWRMSPEDYEKGISREVLRDGRLARMERVEHPVLKETARQVLRKRRAAYQENILGDLLADLKQYTADDRRDGAASAGEEIRKGENQ